MYILLSSDCGGPSSLALSKERFVFMTNSIESERYCVESASFYIHAVDTSTHVYESTWLHFQSFLFVAYWIY